MVSAFRRIEKKRALAHGLDLFDQSGELAAVFVPDRLDRILEWLLVRDVIDLDIAALHSVEGFSLFLVPQLARIGLRLTRELFEQRLVIRRQLLPSGFRKTSISGTIRCWLSV